MLLTDIAAFCQLRFTHFIFIFRNRLNLNQLLYLIRLNRIELLELRNCDFAQRTRIGELSPFVDAVEAKNMGTGHRLGPLLDLLHANTAHMLKLLDQLVIKCPVFVSQLLLEQFRRVEQLMFGPLLLPQSKFFHFMPFLSRRRLLFYAFNFFRYLCNNVVEFRL